MKRALLIGIRYIGSNMELCGCGNDVDDMMTVLCMKGYSEFTILEDSKNGSKKLGPTRENIIAAIKSVVADTKAGDTLFVHYSGHGGQVPDANGDECDGLDECIVPVDYADSGIIIDDELRQLLVNELPEGANLVALFDCCHSGSALDLPYRMIENQSFIESDDVPKCKNIIFISGCKDNQFSADADFNDRANGALTRVFIDSVGHRGNWADFLQILRKKLLIIGFDQIPQLCVADESKYYSSFEF